MKYDFVCKSDPVSHINNRKTTTQDKNARRVRVSIPIKKEHKRDSSFIAPSNKTTDFFFVLCFSSYQCEMLIMESRR